MDRREFLVGTGLSALMLAAASTARGADTPSFAKLEDFIAKEAEARHIPGVSAILIRKGDVIWSHTHGFADLDKKTPMSLDALQNIGSISKTFATTALMQLKEAGKVSLDADINTYLPFPVRNPNFPDVPITVRQLLTHVSSLKDGISYSKLYACGDPTIDLATWLKDYYTPGARFYDAAENFHTYKPGDGWDYCNLAFGLVACIVQLVSGEDFSAYCRRMIFEPLKLDKTAWYLAEVDLTKHLTPYTWVEGGKPRGPDWGGLPQGVIQPEGPTFDKVLPDGYQANCPYNHPNFPDGFLRSSADHLSRYLRAYLGGGEFEGGRILTKESIAEMLTVQMVNPKQRSQGLVWYADKSINNMLSWGHGGNDPGINNDVRMLPELGLASIVMTNTNGIKPQEFSNAFLEGAIAG